MMAGPSNSRNGGKATPAKTKESGSAPPDLWRYAAVALVVVLAFFAAYSYALGQGGPVQGTAVSRAYAGQGQGATPAAAAGGCCGVGGAGATAGGGGCCGTGAPQKKIEKVATVIGSEQVVDLTVNNGYSPNYITAKAGLPLRIKIDHPSQGGCDGVLVFPDFGVQKTLAPNSRDEILLAPAKAGTYRFTCGMGMLSGTLVLR
jgi:hypothetical protein